MPDKVTPLWQMWRTDADEYLRLAQVAKERKNPKQSNYLDMEDDLRGRADELQAACKRVRERVMALPNDYLRHDLIKRDAVLKILREEGVLDG